MLFTEKEVIQALHDGTGFLEDTRVALCNLGEADKTGRTVDYRALYNYIHKTPLVLEWMTHIREQRNDVVESSLYKRAKAGDLKAIQTWLNAHAKDRGYGPPVPAAAVDTSKQQSELVKYTLPSESLSAEEWMKSIN